MVLGRIVLELYPQKTLAVNETVLNLVKERKHAELSPHDIPLNDVKTYKMLTDGHILRVFPIESPLSANACRRIQPSRIQHIAALIAFQNVAFYNQEFVECIALYAARKHGEAPVTYGHHILEPILGETYGIMVYREQYVQAVELLAGYSCGHADLLRRANLRDDPSVIAKHLPVFVEGCARQNNIPANMAAQLFDGLNRGAKHLVSKTYSVSSSLLAYQTAYLKAHYPSDFYSVLLEHYCNDPSYVLRIRNEMTLHSEQTT
jgi:DNA polymerase-3 subunit alpha